jgi:hypothetical protein
MAAFERFKQPIARQILEFHRKRGTLGSAPEPQSI